MSKQIPHDIEHCSESHFKITLCQHGRGLYPHPHQQDQIKIIYVLRGQLQIEINSSIYSVSTGDLFLFFPNELHTINTAEIGEAAVWEIIYDRKLLYSASQSTSDNQFLFSFTVLGQMGQRLFKRNTLVEHKIPALINSMLEENEAHECCSDVAVRLYLCHLSLWFLRCWKSADEGWNQTLTNDIYSTNLLQKIFTFVDQEYMNKIKMETIASQCNMSYHSFSKFFIAHTGKTFPRYVNEVRLTKAKILLTTSGMNITEIAMEVGYISTSHFIQRFKESNKMTPYQFRTEFKN